MALVVDMALNLQHSLTVIYKRDYAVISQRIVTFKLNHCKLLNVELNHIQFAMSVWCVLKGNTLVAYNKRLSQQHHRKLQYPAVVM